VKRQQVELQVLFSLIFSELDHDYPLRILSLKRASTFVNAAKMRIVERSFYHSAITFLAIGYGDFYPSGHIRWLSATKGWVGLFQMSYFTVAFVRKILW
jgi:hypothetical protein